MRTLLRNKVSLWLVIPTGYTENVDGEGFKTGEITYTYASPLEIYINLYPETGDISDQPFGPTEMFDMYAVTDEYDLEKECYLFYEEPAGNYDTTYDFKVSKKMKSLNSYTYGLKARV